MHLILKAVAQWADDMAMGETWSDNWTPKFKQLASLCREIARGL